MKKTLIVLTLISVLFLTACSSPADTETTPEESSIQNISTPTEATTSVDILEFKFVPDTLEINVGESVIWEHNDKVTHKIVFPAFESDNMERGDTFTHTFDTSRTYEYYCSIHPTMRGVIVVK